MPRHRDRQLRVGALQNHPCHVGAALGSCVPWRDAPTSGSSVTGGGTTKPPLPRRSRSGLLRALARCPDIGIISYGWEGTQERSKATAPTWQARVQLCELVRAYREMRGATRTGESRFDASSRGHAGAVQSDRTYVASARRSYFSLVGLSITVTVFSFE